MPRDAWHRTIVLGLLVFWSAAASYGRETPSREEKLEFFERKIRPVLHERCIECHGPEKQHNGLRLDSSEGLRRGGDSGPAIDVEHPEQSLIIQAMRHESLVMPPLGEKLPEAVVANFVRWIAAGAVDPRVPSGPANPIQDAAKTHWAFQPINNNVSPPRVENSAWPRSPIDRFLLAKQEEAGVRPAPAARRRVLIRRATWDLIGLPPTPEQIEAFVSDPAPDAYSKVIDRLLASSEYGERWGRHWLDVVRYADTAGETADFPAPQAWRYRNYVIDAFNDDKPYDEFIREQIAGDILAAEAASKISTDRYAELVTATGYLAIARRFGFDSTKDHYLTIEDTIDTLGKSILGLTIACARCHDHKYDPIPTADYYSLYGILASTQYAFPGCEAEKRPRDLVPLLKPVEYERHMAAHRTAIQTAKEKVERLQADVDQLRTSLRRMVSNPAEILLSGEISNGSQQEIPVPTGPWTVQKGDFVQLSVLPKSNYGADTTVVEVEIVEVDGGGKWNFTSDLLAAFQNTCEPGPWRCFGLHDGPKLFTQLISNAQQTPGLSVWQGDEALPNLAVNPLERELAFLTVKLPPRQVALHPGSEGGVAIAWVSPVAGRITIRGRIADADGSGGDGVAWTVQRRRGFGTALRALRTSLAALRDAKQQHSELAARGPNIPMAYAVSESETPHDVRIQKRGEPENLGEQVPRQFLEVLGGQRVERAESVSGRLQLAQWLTDPGNPLTARVLVNRIWQHHFGRGLVATPNNFGLRGRPPTHPKLLDWLAAEFIRSGWSIKHMHRAIMQSAAYRLSVEPSPAGNTIDPENHLYWRFERQRLDAEQIRDGLLAVSGQLDRTPGKAHPFPPVSEWNFTQHAPFDEIYKTKKRSVYLMTPRIRSHPFLGLFDGADPNAPTARRTTSTVPPQALFFMNDPFLHEQAAALAERLTRYSEGRRERTDYACRLLYGRPAGEADHRAAKQFLDTYAAELRHLDAKSRQAELWNAYARVLLSCNEFLYVE